LKYLDILLTSLGDLAVIKEDSLLILAGLLFSFSPFFLLLTGLTFGVHLNVTFCLKEFLKLSVKRESHPEL